MAFYPLILYVSSFLELCILLILTIKLDVKWVENNVDLLKIVTTSQCKGSFCDLRHNIHINLLIFNKNNIFSKYIPPAEASTSEFAPANYK